MNVTSDDRINHYRHIILAIAGATHERGTNLQIDKLLKILRKNSTGQIKLISNKLLKEQRTYSNQEIWLFTILWQLSLDKEEMLTIIAS
jgi:hypothetical protein